MGLLDEARAKKKEQPARPSLIAEARARKQSETAQPAIAGTQPVSETAQGSPIDARNAVDTNPDAGNMDVQQAQPQQPQAVSGPRQAINDAILSTGPGRFLTELAAAAGKPIAETLDFFGPDAINNALQLFGSEARVPTVRGAGIGEGGFMEPGLARSVTQAAGMLAPVAASFTPVVGRNLASAGGIALEALGVGSAKVAAPIKAVADTASQAVSQAFPSKAQQAAKLPLYRGTGDAAAAGFKLDKAGRIVKDAVQQAALKADIPSDTVAFIAASNPQSKARMLKQLEVLEKGKINRKFRAFNAPQQVIGEALEDRLSIAFRVNKEAASQLDEVANALKGQKIDVSGPIEAFKENLAKQRITITKNGSLDFKGSSIEGENMQKAQSIIKNVYNRLRYTEDPTKNALRVHDAKKFIDEQVSYGKSAEGLSGTMQGIVKKLRHDLDSLLDSNFAEYNRVNTAYAESRRVIDDVQSLAGQVVDLTGDNASKALGTMSRKVLTNYANGQNVDAVFDALDGVGQKYGKPDELVKIGDDIRDLVTMESFLRETFARAAKPGSLEGIGRNVAGGVIDAKTGNVPGIISRGAKALGEVFSKTEEQKLQALRDLLTK